MAAQDYSDKSGRDLTSFDIGAADEIATCTSCHMGGGAYEVDRNGNRFDTFQAEHRDEIAAGKYGLYNGDYYRYDVEDIAAAPMTLAAQMQGGPASPALSHPKMHDWTESGVLEAECLTCHVKPSQDRLQTADGVKVTSYAPRLRIFVVAKMNKKGDDIADIHSISVGRYPTRDEIPKGYKVYSPLAYSSPLDGQFEGGKFYSWLNSPVASSRDFVKIPIVEGGKPAVLGGKNGFRLHNAYDPSWAKVQGPNGETFWGTRKALGYYFKYAATAALMGLDLDGDGVPMTYVRMVKKPGLTLADLPEKAQSYFDIQTYYDPDDLKLAGDMSGTKLPILASDDHTTNDWNLTCARCHTAYIDPVNDGLYIRPDVMGMKADVPKRGTFWKMDYAGQEDYDKLLAEVESGERSPGDLVGYDVHAAKGMQCIDCHSKGNDNPMKPDHNFPKGLDMAGTVRNDLDYDDMKVCTDCHDHDQTVAKHAENFGGDAMFEHHLDKVACETCHVPSKRYWPFRTFDYSMGFTYNFDSRHMPNPMDPGDVNAMTPFSAFSALGIEDPQPGYYASAPFYGIGGLNWAGQSNPLYGVDVVTSIAYFDPYGPDAMEAMRLKMQGKDPKWGNRPMDPYAMFYTMMTDMDGAVQIPNITPDMSQDELMKAMGGFIQSANGTPYFNFTPVLIKKADKDGKLKLYPASPVAAITWIERVEGGVRVLEPRELNSILAGAVSRKGPGGRSQMGIALITSKVTRDKNGAITDFDPATIVWDDNMDLRPEISNETELDLVHDALVKVLQIERGNLGLPAKDPDLAMAIVAHNFSVSHNILPGSQALGAKKDYDRLGGVDPQTHMPKPAPGNVEAGKVAQCVDCHADGNKPTMGGDPDLVMNARLSNRRIVYIPWTIQGFEDLVKKGKIWVEPEISWIHPIDANGDGDTDDVSPDFSHVKPDGSGMVIPGDFIGATQAEVIEHSEEAARAFAGLAGLPTDGGGEHGGEEHAE